MPIPSLTYSPSRSSRATRLTIRSRTSIAASFMPEKCSYLAGCPFFDALLVFLALEDVLHENAGRDHVVRIDFPRLEQVLHFGDGDAGRGRHHRIEVAGGAAVDQIADAVAFPAFDEGEVGAQRHFEHER